MKQLVTRGALAWVLICAACGGTSTRTTSREGVVSDVVFDPATARTISVDVRYLIWMLDLLDGGDWLIEEMGLQPRLPERSARAGRGPCTRLIRCRSETVGRGRRWPRDPAAAAAGR